MFFGKNSLNSRRLFEERKLYQEVMDSPINGNTLLDTWYDFPYYGRIDNKWDVVLPKPRKMKSISQDNTKKILMLNFAADMFNDLVEYWNSLLTTGNLNTQTSKILAFEPKRAWVNVELLYQKYMNTLYGVFQKHILGNKYKPKTVEDMVDYLSIYLKENKNFSLINKTAFTISKFSDIRVTGLVVDLTDDPIDNDEKKWNYLSDPNFVAFKDAAQRFGFKVDQNIPWRLIVDIQSPVVEDYLKNYDLTSDNVYDVLYDKVYLTEMETLNDFMDQFWEALKNRLKVQRNMFCNESRSLTIIQRKKAPQQPINE